VQVIADSGKVYKGAELESLMERKPQKEAVKVSCERE
jgi:hypothetical protein